ncbi:MAG: hypothetical protein Q8T11_12200 [Elusimicrobiota bacterium]|nr:hypothetical protein [Elusimicrobiota bacterium]
MPTRKEIERVIFDVLKGDRRRQWGLADFLAQVDDHFRAKRIPFDLQNDDGRIAKEAIWEMANKGLMMPHPNSTGAWDQTPFPRFNVTSFGERCAEGRQYPAGLDDIIDVLREELREIDLTVEFYLVEAIQTYHAQCYNASAVMVGVAAEKVIRRLIDSYQSNLPEGRQKDELQRVLQQRLIGRIFEVFNKQMQLRLGKLPEHLKEHYRPQLETIYESMIKSLRDDAGHPKGIEVDRWQALAHLYLFITYCRYCEQLSEWFKGNLTSA